MAIRPANVCDICEGFDDSADEDSDGTPDGCDACVWYAGNTCPPCTDNEANYQLYISGKSMDVCESQSKLIEVVCKNGKPVSTPVSCKKEFGPSASCKGNICVVAEDKDKDGTADGDDNCPDWFNKDQKDIDNDGVGDACDADKDGDGKNNDKDNCPDVYNPDQIDSDGDGLGDACDSENNLDPCNPPADEETKEICDCLKSSDADKCLPKIPEDKTFGEVVNDAGGSSSCDGDSKESFFPSISTMNFYAITGKDYHQWAAGEGGNIFKRYGDEKWTAMASPWDIAGMKASKVSDEERGITDLFGIGKESVAAVTKSGHFFLWFNAHWIQWGPSGPGDGKSFGSPLYAVHGTGKDDIWIAGDNGAIFHFDGSKWKSEKIGGDSFWAIFTKAGQSSRIKVVWRDIFAEADGRVFLVGDKGKIAYRQYNKNEDSVKSPMFILQKFWNSGHEAGFWTEIDIKNDVDLRAVWSDGNDVRLGGSKGLFWCGKTSFDVCHEFPSQSTILGISGSSKDDLAVVGTHSIFYLKSASAWSKEKLPFPNSLTGVYKEAQFVSASGINGTLYDLDKETASAKFIQRESLTHREWAKTRWTSATGSVDEFWVSGDDLSVGHFKGATSKIIYSDESYLPFSDYEKRDFRDILVLDGYLYAVGNVGYLLQGKTDNSEWQKIAYPAAFAKYSNARSPAGLLKLSHHSQMSPDMRSVRKRDGGVLVAGNLGLFFYDRKSGEFKFLKGTGSPAVALHYEEKDYLAKDDEVLYGIFPAAYQAIKLPTNLLPQDIAESNGAVYIIGRESSEKELIGSGVPESSKNFKPDIPFIKKHGEPEKIANKSRLAKISEGKADIVVSNDKAFLGLRSVYFKLEGKGPLPDIPLAGYVIMGEDGYISIFSGKSSLPIATEEELDIYDGLYKVKEHYLKITNFLEGKVRLKWSADVIGVGETNKISKFDAWGECKVGF